MYGSNDHTSRISNKVYNKIYLINTKLKIINTQQTKGKKLETPCKTLTPIVIILKQQ